MIPLIFVLSECVCLIPSRSPPFPLWRRTCRTYCCRLPCLPRRQRTYTLFIGPVTVFGLDRNSHVRLRPLPHSITGSFSQRLILSFSSGPLTPLTRVLVTYCDSGTYGRVLILFYRAQYHSVYPPYVTSVVLESHKGPTG